MRNRLANLIHLGRDLSPITSAISAHLKEITEEGFDKEQDPSTGKDWDDLSEVRLEQRKKSRHVNKGGNAKKLQVSRNLIDSIGADFDETSAVVGTNLVYARTHPFGAKKGQFGTGTYKTKKGSFPIPWGDIPARPFLGLDPKGNDQDRHPSGQAVQLARKQYQSHLTS